MTVIPSFLAKRIYRKGSLRETAEGIAFDLKNLIGPGMITGINFIKINDQIYDSDLIKIIASGVSTIANHINSENPMLFKFNDEATCLLQGANGLNSGKNKIMVELISRDVGKIQVCLTDSV